MNESDTPTPASGPPEGETRFLSAERAEEALPPPDAALSWGDPVAPPSPSDPVASIELRPEGPVSSPSPSEDFHEARTEYGGPEPGLSESDSTRDGRRATRPDDISARRTVGYGERATEPTGLVASAYDPATKAPKAVRGYTILREIASGGMGTVYEAEQDRPRRVVALKVVKPGMATSDLIRRFEFEAEILAQLRHPGIAQIHEAGTFDTGRGPQPFFAMEFIRGKTLMEYVRTYEPTLREKVDLLAKICDAVEHAHQKAVIHRDLKPGNIMVDESGQPKILDFGLARVDDGESTRTMHTAVGAVLGTLYYMSPEQAEGRTDEIDTRSDIFALGVIAYEVLTGRLPFDFDSMGSLDILNAISTKEPRSMSKHDRNLRGDLETIVRKALEKEKGKRYASASVMADDLRRYLADEPIVARPPTAWYQVKKFSRRNRGLMGGVVAAFVALFLGICGTAFQAMRVAAERDTIRGLNANLASAYGRANEETARAERSLYSIRMAAGFDAIERGDRDLARAFAAKYPPGSSLRKIEARLLDASLGRRLLVEATAPPAGFETRVAIAISADGRRLAAAESLADDAEIGGEVRLWNMDDGTTRTLVGHSGGVMTLAFSPDGNLLATGGYDATVRIWTLGSDAPPAVATGFVDRLVATAFSRDGTRIAAASGPMAPGIRPTDLRILDTNGKDVRPPYSIVGSIREIRFLPDGLMAYVAGEAAAHGAFGGRLTVLDPISGKEKYSRPLDYAPASLAVSPDGRLFALGMTDKTVRIVEAETGADMEVLFGHEGFVLGAAFSPDGRHLLTGDCNPLVPEKPGRVVVWRTAEWKRVDEFSPATDYESDAGSGERPAQGVFAIRIADTGGIAIGGTRGALRLFSRRHSPSLAVHDDEGDAKPVVAVEFADDETLRTASGSVPLHLAKGWISFEAAARPSRMRTWAIRPGGGCEPTGEPIAVGGNVMGGALGGETVLLARGTEGTDGGDALIALDPATGKELARAELPPRPNQRREDVRIETARGSPDGRTLAVALRDYRILLWTPATGAPPKELLGHTVEVSALAFSPDGKVLASGDHIRERGFTLMRRQDPDEGLRLWDAESGTAQGPAIPFPGIVGLAFSPDGKRLAVGVSRDRSIRILDAETRMEEANLVGHAGLPCALAFSRDGETLVSGGATPLVRFGGVWRSEGEIRFWDVESREVKGTLGSARAGVLCLAFSPDGDRLVAGLTTGEARIWEAAPEPIFVRDATAEPPPAPPTADAAGESES